MSAIAASTRDALAAFIAAAMTGGSPLLTPQIPVQAIYDITFNLKQLQGGQCIVVPAQKEPALLMRNGALGQQNDIVIHAAVQYKYSTAPSAAELDPYLNLIEQIETQVMGQKMSNGAWCISASYPHGLFLERHMTDFRVFTSVVALKFKLGV